MLLETVKITHPIRGWVIINKSDFDPNLHTIYGQKKEASKQEELAPVKEAPKPKRG